MMNQAIIVVILGLLSHTQALIGYDCGSPNSNITTLSLLEVGDCEVSVDGLNISSQYIQLLQLNEFRDTKVEQCKIEMKSTVYYCGQGSHVAVVHNGRNEYIIDAPRDLCKRMHESGTYTYGPTFIAGLKSNNSEVRGLTLAGRLDPNGYCEGAPFSDPYGAWSNVVVQGTIKITLTDYTAQINLETNRIHLRSGVTCTLVNSNCVDLEGGNTHWNSIPQDNCNFNHYSVLYEGIADKMTDEDTDVNLPSRVIYSLSTKDTTFALSQKSIEVICGFSIIKTEHPKLIIFETTKGVSFASSEHVSTNNLDIFIYVNSKFVYVERHIRSQLKNLYFNARTQRCNIERKALANSLTIATQAPDEFAYHLMQGPGYMAVVAGEVVHIVKCIPVEVKPLRTDNCYQQLPVTRQNLTLYLSPRTHILTHTGTQITCNEYLPALYRIHDAWYRVLNRPVETHAPHVIKPMTGQSEWRYVNPASLATSGIYSESDLNELRTRILFPMERPAVLDNVARGMTGQTMTIKGDITTFFDEQSVSHLARSMWESVWTKFTILGTVSAGLMGIYMVVAFAKSIINMLVHGYALHTIYGWSLHLLGTLFSSVTSLLLHLRRESTDRNNRHQGNDVEMGKINPDIPVVGNHSTESATAPVTDSTRLLAPAAAATTDTGFSIFPNPTQCQK